MVAWDHFGPLQYERPIRMSPSVTAAPAFAAGLSTLAQADRAVEEVLRQAVGNLQGQADFGVAFVSPHHAEEFADIAAELQRQTRARCLIGCTGESIVGTGREVEDQPAVSLWLAQLPGVHVGSMHLRFERTPEGGLIAGWPELPDPWPSGSALIVLAEPFSFPADLLLHRLNDDQPGVPVLGGMASGAHSPGGNRLLLNGEELTEGAVAVLLSGPVQVRSVVSQGCRPIGRPFVVTKADRHVIFELGGKPPLLQLQELYPGLSQEEREAMRSGLHVGVVTNEYQDKFARGDFLVRNVVGADTDTGAMALGDYVRVGQTVQFHIRDQHSADEDLRELLGSFAQSGSAAKGALLFTCNGRGTRLFEKPHHDAGVVQELLGDIPLAGFFAQGEIGPIARKNFVHGFTASLAVFGAQERPA
jgi:small ligand-binding sensory domain FIST